MGSLDGSSEVPRRPPFHVKHALDRRGYLRSRSGRTRLTWGNGDPRRCTRSSSPRRASHVPGAVPCAAHCRDLPRFTYPLLASRSRRCRDTRGMPGEDTSESEATMPGSPRSVSLLPGPRRSVPSFRKASRQPSESIRIHIPSRPLSTPQAPELPRSTFSSLSQASGAHDPGLHRRRCGAQAGDGAQSQGSGMQLRRLPGFPGFPASRLSRLPGFPGFPAFPASRLPGFPASRLPGFPGFPASRP